MWHAIVMTVLAAVLGMMVRLSPADDPLARYGDLAVALAVDAVDEPPLYRDDPDRSKTISLLVAVSFRESSFRARAVGDHGHSFCAFQIHDSSGGSPALLDDVRACVRAAHRMLLASERNDPAHPVAFYARGGRYLTACVRGDGTAPVCAEARRLSDDRMALARWVRGAP